MTYVAWGWPILLVNSALDMWAGESTSAWRAFLDNAAFAWILCLPAAPITLLLDRSRRERAMAWLCGLREGDERERAVTGDAARSTLLLALSLQTVLLVMSLMSAHLIWNPLAKKGERGLITVGITFDPSRHLDPFGNTTPANAPKVGTFGGFLLTPSAFPVLALLILIQIAAFKAFSGKRYAGADA